MPQFDVFLFSSSVFYLLVGIFSLMFYNQLIFLPKISAILKLREKIQGISHATGSQKVAINSNFSKISKTLY